MTSNDNLEEKLHELSDAIDSDDKLVENVMDRIHSAPAKDDVGAGHIRRIIMKPSLMKLAAAAVIAVVAWMAISYLRSPAYGPPKVYAAMLEALHHVDTVRVTGWTTRIRPRHTSVGDTPFDTTQQYPIEIWEWFTEKGEYRMFEKQGPITIWQDEDLRYEYQENKDTLYIDKYKKPLRLSVKFRWFAREIESLITMRDDEVTVRADRITLLDNTSSGGKAQGYQIDRDDRREEIWLDKETGLMLENNAYIFVEGKWKQWRHGVFVYDLDIPAHIRAYVPPDTERVTYSSDIDPKFEKYRLRLLEIAGYYRDRPLPETMELLLRANGEKLDTWYSPGRLIGITDTTGYWVLPIQSSLADFLRSRIKPYGSLRVPEELQNIQLNVDLITKNDHTLRERADFVLDSLSLEIVEVSEQRKVWMAHYDGRSLKPWRQVKAPVEHGDARHTKPGMDFSSNPHTMEHLFESFAYYQDYDLGADRLIIIDETGLPSEPTEGQTQESVAVSSASPFWRGDESIEMAREWFRKEFGVTFTEEIRPMIVHVVHRRGDE